MFKKILMVADSPLELLLSIQVKIAMFRDVQTTIVLTDRSPGAYNTYKNVKKQKIFDCVLYVKESVFWGCKFCKLLPKKINEKLRDTLNVFIAKRILVHHDSYDLFITSEIDFFSKYMFLALSKNAKFYLISEGIYGFSGLEESIKRNKLVDNSSRLFLDRLSAILYYGPKIGKLPTSKEIQIPSVNCNRGEFVSLLNSIYNYEPHKIMIENKIILFEESYANDGGNDDCVYVLKRLIEKYGNQRVMLKRHPRDRENRFTQIGINSIEPYSVPWEMFVLNGDCKNCVLLAANSASVYLCKLWDLCKEPVYCIMLNELMNYEYVGGSCMDMYMQFLKKMYKKVGIMVPQSFKDLFYSIDSIRNEAGEKNEM